ncbi:MAG: 16S rRNA (cytidine(1402)-2'-O)-methyltransferase [Acidimicrobiia bacterium]
MPLVVIGTPIGNLGDLSSRVIETLRTADVIACEDTRRTRKLLSHAGIPADGRLRAVHAHNEEREAERIVEEVRAGKTVAYATDAGMPGVSDPGARVVLACRVAGLPVEVVPGPSAALAALALSGFSADRFVFEGFLPRKGKPRVERIEAIATEPRTVVLFEAPGRVSATLDDLAAACRADRLVCVAREITKLHEEVWHGPIADAAALARAADPRGEHVIVLDGEPADTTPASDHALEAAVREALDRGLSARDAAAEVAAALSVPKRRAYELAITFRNR